MQLIKRAVRRIQMEVQAVQAIRQLRERGIDVVQLALQAKRPPKHCPVCNHHGPFNAFGNPPRWDAQCPHCFSLERHRHLALLLKEGQIRKPSDILHFAPEPCVRTLLQPFAKTYITADIDGRNADTILNIEAIDLPDNSFDVIVCSHVLEHVDDAKALRELRRVLRKDGMIIIAVPVYEGCTSTYENPEITSPEQRTIHFGQHDHVRVYGADFRDRLTSAGLSFKERTAAGSEAIDFGLCMGDKIFVCMDRSRTLPSPT